MPTIKNKTYVKEPKVVQRHEVTFNVPKLKVPKPFQGFMDFIRGYGVVALTVGIFLGTSLKTVLDSITVGFINPIIALLTGNLNLNALSVCISHTGTTCKTSINYGVIISSVISFILAAFMVYLIIRLFRLDKFDQKKE